MRIAILASGVLPVLDGVTVSVDARVRRLVARGDEVLLLAPASADRTRPAGLSPAVTFAALPSMPFGAAASDRNVVPEAAAEIDRALAGFRPDLIHVDEPERLALGLRRLPARAFARRHRVPLVAFFHTNFADYLGSGGNRYGLYAPLRAVVWRAVAQLYNRYDATLVPSAASLARLQRFGLANGLAGRFNGTDTQDFHPDLRRPGYWSARWGRPDLDGRAVMLIAGRLTADKGWADWRQVLPALAERLGDSLAVVVAGDGALREEVEQLVAALPCGFFTGPVPRAEIGTLLANSDLYATLSRFENASLAVYEALASGLPVLAFEAGGLPGQVRHGVNGLLFRPGDAPGFVEGTARLVEDAAARHALRAGALAERPLLDWDRAFAAWLDALSAVDP